MRNILIAFGALLIALVLFLLFNDQLEDTVEAEPVEGTVAADPDIIDDGTDAEGTDN